ncbi:MAG: nuclear transport factor 2 family protein [Bacteroidales bacterium]|nr:nuclear transport factor 2 family protein [Bacteroidales bacterium]
MKNTSGLLLILLIFLTACQSGNDNSDREKWLQEIASTEQAFADLAAQEGIEKAFVSYAAADVVLLRNKQLIRGKDGLSRYFAENAANDQPKLSWKPDFIDVSTSGDLGYTYGKYVYSSIDSAGITTSTEGVFHTVWKRQADGQWRFVWD